VSAGRSVFLYLLEAISPLREYPGVLNQCSNQALNKEPAEASDLHLRAHWEHVKKIFFEYSRELTTSVGIQHKLGNWCIACLTWGVKNV
jgi:hypothetical protein